MVRGFTTLGFQEQVVKSRLRSVCRDLLLIRFASGHRRHASLHVPEPFQAEWPHNAKSLRTQAFKLPSSLEVTKWVLLIFKGKARNGAFEVSWTRDGTRSSSQLWSKLETGNN